MLRYERQLRANGKDFIVGIDEAGRGPLAGPVVAAAVVLAQKRFENRIDDSKKLSSVQREAAFREITASSLFGVGVINEKLVDELNIHKATLAAMEEAVHQLFVRAPAVEPGRVHVLVDGNMKPGLPYPLTSVIGGDGRSISIASASIVAKVIRDRIMNVYDQVFPLYGFLGHKGYATSSHRRAILEFGQCAIHRRSFRCTA